MKRCIACGEEKPLTDYYRHPQMTDGHLSKCKDCQKASSRATRLARLDDYREHDRLRAGLPQRVLMRKVYQASARGRELTAIGRKTWIKRNPGKRSAHIIADNAIRDGRLIRQPCEVCGDTKVEAHHDDYGRPLTVRWLCPTHHAEWHKAEREKARTDQAQVVCGLQR